MTGGSSGTPGSWPIPKASSRSSSCVVVVVAWWWMPASRPFDDPQPVRTRPPRRTAAPTAAIVPIAWVLGRWVLSFTLISFPWSGTWPACWACRNAGLSKLAALAWSPGRGSSAGCSLSGLPPPPGAKPPPPSPPNPPAVELTPWAVAATEEAWTVPALSGGALDDDRVAGPKLDGFRLCVPGDRRRRGERDLHELVRRGEDVEGVSVDDGDRSGGGARSARAGAATRELEAAAAGRAGRAGCAGPAGCGIPQPGCERGRSAGRRSPSRGSSARSRRPRSRARARRTATMIAAGIPSRTPLAGARTGHSSSSSSSGSEPAVPTARFVACEGRVLRCGRIGVESRGDGRLAPRGPRAPARRLRWCGCRRSFVAKCVDGPKRGGAVGRVEPEEDADGDRDPEGERDRVAGDDRV